MVDPENFIIYFKIPYTEIRDLFTFPKHLTINDFLDCINTGIRIHFDINEKYAIEVVEVRENSFDGPNELAPPIRPSTETLNERYGHLYDKNRTMAFYIRPVHPDTGEFIRQENYVN